MPPMLETSAIKPLYIAGGWVAGADSRANINPSDTRDVVGWFADASPAQCTEAIAAAQGAQALWARQSPQVRANALARIGDELQTRQAELADLLAREEGKALPDAAAEVQRAAQVFQFFAGEALRIGGELLPSTRAGLSVEITREPVGVVAVITPWNFPLAIPAWKIAPALACGNAVVFKPAELVPACAWALTEIIARAGLPPGTFNLVMGSGQTLGPALTDDPRVQAITFTGSEATGRKIAHAAVTRPGTMARFQLEMGGKNPLVVLDDADLPRAVACALQGAFHATGQRCTASSRLIVVDAIHDAFVQGLIEGMQALVVGDARASGTTIGPVVDARQLAQDQHYIELGLREGGQLAWGGLTWPTWQGQPGYYLQPALFVDTVPTMALNREEVFGPVASVVRVRDADEALAVANGTPYGLSAGVMTQSLQRAAWFKRELQAGMVMVNAPTAGVDPHVPFGGRKASSHGPREQGRYAQEFFTTVKTTYVDAGSGSA